MIWLSEKEKRHQHLPRKVQRFSFIRVRDGHTKIRSALKKDTAVDRCSVLSGNNEQRKMVWILDVSKTHQTIVIFFGVTNYSIKHRETIISFRVTLCLI